MSKHRKIKKVNRMFDEYKRYIGTMFVEKFGTSYMRFEDIQDNWRSMVKYTPDAEAELLMYTRVYVRNLNYRCLDAMEILTGQIADFLAEYLVKKHPKQDSSSVQSVTADIKASLWNKSGYIQTLLQKEQQAQERKKLREEAKALAAAKAAAKAAAATEAAAIEAEKATQKTPRPRIPMKNYNGVTYVCVRELAARKR